MKFLQADIDSIVEAQENGSLTIFIGAGFSKFSETENIKFPTWGELIQELKEELHTKENDYLKIAQLYFLEFGEYKLYAKLKKFIPLHASPSKFHKKLFELLESKYVITTNWDNLLEKTISSNGLIYDVIKSEVDLVKSNIPSKLIKIHGDFDSHNVVFKEDDYLNYSIQNPLFDNFMKHMLSTTTVLFLGYSYSDNDLKQIIKWVEKNSKASPPRFIVSKGLSDGEKKYLENHGIKTLQILNESKELTYENLYQTLFECIEKTKTGTVIFENEKNTDEFVVNYFYKKIVGLSDLRVLLPEQITHLFSNCGIEYHNNCFGLHLYSNQSTIDYDKNLREVYKQFFDILNSLDGNCKFRNKINYIVSRILSSGIVFIKNEERVLDLRKFFSDEEVYNCMWYGLSEFVEFSSDMPKFNSELLTYNSKSNSDKLRLFAESYSHIIDNFKEKKYLSSIISKFNHSAIAMKLNLDNEFKNDEIRKSFVKVQRNEFTNELISNNYPSSVKKYFQPVIDLLNFKYVYKLYFDSIQDNNTFLNLEKSKRDGGFGFDSNEQRSNDRLIHLLRFCAGNDIVLDLYKEFKTLMRSYVIGKINIQNIKEKFELSRYDLFILIKYIDFKDLWNLIAKDILVFVKETEGKGESFLFFDEDSKSYLKATFNNLSELFIKYSHFFYSNTISKSFINLILILSLVKWEREVLDLLLQKIKEIFVKVDIPLDFIRALNYFVLTQYKLYKDMASENLVLIDAILEGFILGKFRKPFYQRVNDDLTHVYQLPSISNIEYSNKNLIEKALFHLDKDFEDEKVKRYFLQKFLLPVYDISNRDTKQVFISYFDKLRLLTWSNEIPDLYNEIFRELDFLQYGCEVRGDFISFLDNWIENKFNKELMHDFNFIKSGGEELMLQYFDFLIHEKDLEAFEHLKETLEQKIAQIKKTSS